VAVNNILYNMEFLSLGGEPDLKKIIIIIIINRFQSMRGTVRKHLKKTQTETQMKFYEVAAGPTLLYGSETWVTTK
jgi:hypothetical protein